MKATYEIKWIENKSELCDSRSLCFFVYTLNDQHRFWEEQKLKLRLFLSTWSSR